MSFLSYTLYLWKRKEETAHRYSKHTDGIEKLIFVYWPIVDEILTAVLGKGMVDSSPVLVGMFACHS